MAAAAATAETSSSTTRSSGGGGGATADSYIGSLISLTSKSEIRYEGILYNINTDESSIGLRNVRSFGTEGRKKDGPQVPPSDKIYEYILFRGSDIKDLLVKSSPPVQTAPHINSDPAIIQSHYAPPTTNSASLPTNVSGPLTDLASQSAQLGHPGSSFQGGLPLYQPGGNMGSWGPSPTPQNANGTGLAMPMYWQGFYGAPNGLPQLHQQSLLRPPTGLLMPPPMQQMQFSGFNASLPTGGSNLPEYSSALAPSTSSSLNVTSSSLPSKALPSTMPPPMQPMSQASEMLPAVVSNKASVSCILTSTLGAPLPSISTQTTSGPDVNAVIPPISVKPNAISGASLLHQTSSQPVTSVAGPFSSVLAEAPTPSLVTPGQLLQSATTAGPATVPSIQSSQTAQKDVEVVQVSPNPSSEPPAPVRTEAQPPILSLPASARTQRPSGVTFHTRQNFRGRGGRGSSISRPMANFTEEFDFMAMNEKFKKEEVWGSLGKTNKSKDKEGNESDDGDVYVDDDTELPKVEKPVYNKDDFFDNLSSNALDNDSNHGRMRFSEQIKLDTETFGDFSRYRGGRGPSRGGRGRGSYYGKGYGYGYAGRGRGRGVSNRS